MTPSTHSALAATLSIRRSPGFAGLPVHERVALERDLDRIEGALRGGGRYDSNDPFALPLETPGDLGGPGLFVGARPAAPASAPAPMPASEAKPRPGTEVLGERARRALDAVDFPSFVAGLIQGTFQAIVDATTQQVREYAQLVADLSKSVDEFTRDNVSENQGRDFLAERHPQDLVLQLPSPGSGGTPKVTPRQQGSAPEWLAEYGLEGETLTAELVEGPLLQAGRRLHGEQRMQSLATLVLMGINRIVIDDGQLKAKLQFHARAREQVSAQVAAQGGGKQASIAGRQTGGSTAVTTMVSTVDVNTQSEVSIKTELVGEVAVRFRTETFDLNRFADSEAIALINRHAAVRQTSRPNTSTPPASPAGDSAGSEPRNG